MIGIKYSCVYCHHPNAPLRSEIREIYAHWQSEHPSQPFRFQAAQTAICHARDAAGTYRELLKHHQDKHPMEPFTLVSRMHRKKCGICDFNGDSLIEHFENVHKEFMGNDGACDPIQLTESELNDLLDIDFERNQCRHCNRSFPTNTELKCHHSSEHFGMLKFATNSVNDQYVCICVHCAKQIDRNAYLQHLVHHSYDYTCSQCPFTTKDLICLVAHDKQDHAVDSLNFCCLDFKNRLKKYFLESSIVFGNGMVLVNHNLLGTKFDESRAFEAYITTEIGLMKEQYQLLLKNSKKPSISMACAPVAIPKQIEPIRPVPRPVARLSVIPLELLQAPPPTSALPLPQPSVFPSLWTTAAVPVSTYPDISALPTPVAAILPPVSSPATLPPRSDPVALQQNIPPVSIPAPKSSKFSTSQTATAASTNSGDDDDDLQQKLQMQNKFLTHLLIYGIPWTDNEDVNQIILDGFQRLKVPATPDDISSIFRIGTDSRIVVIFKEFHVKMRVHRFTRYLSLHTDDFVALLRHQKSTTVYFHYHATPYFKNLLAKLQTFKRSRQIMSFDLGERGVDIQITRNVRINILSIEELYEYLERYRNRGNAKEISAGKQTKRTESSGGSRSRKN